MGIWSDKEEYATKVNLPCKATTTIFYHKHFRRYEECSWGWKDKEKLEEMMDDAAWYLIATSCNGELLGFSHFRFDLDECLEVLYW